MEALQQFAAFVNEFGRDAAYFLLEQNPSSYTNSTGVDTAGRVNPQSPLAPQGAAPDSERRSLGSGRPRRHGNRWDVPRRAPGSSSGVSRPAYSTGGRMSGAPRGAATPAGGASSGGSWATPEPTIGGAGGSGDRPPRSGGVRSSIPQPDFEEAGGEPAQGQGAGEGVWPLVLLRQLGRGGGRAPVEGAGGGGSGRVRGFPARRQGGPPRVNRRARNPKYTPEGGSTRTRVNSEFKGQ